MIHLEEEYTSHVVDLLDLAMVVLGELADFRDA